MKKSLLALAALLVATVLGVAMRRRAGQFRPASPGTPAKPAGALTEADLVLQASASQTAVSNLHTALVYDDPTYNPCANGNNTATTGGNGGGNGGGGGCSAVREEPSPWGNWLVVGSLALVGAALVRRRSGR